MTQTLKPNRKITKQEKSKFNWLNWFLVRILIIYNKLTNSLNEKCKNDEYLTNDSHYKTWYRNNEFLQGLVT